MILRATLSLALTLALASLATANGIRNVDQPGLGTFTSLQAAIDAAGEGDLLLVAKGSYLTGTIDGKSLSIVAMPDSDDKVTRAIVVRNLAAHQVVLLSNLEVQGTDAAGLTLQDNLGHVRVQGGYIIGGRSGSWPNMLGHPGVRITNCQRVVVEGVWIEGGTPGLLSGYQPKPGAHGVEATNSSLALFDSTVTGGNGSEECVPTGGKGGNGLHITGWGAFVSGTTLRGGRGGGGDYIGCNGGGIGGDALDLTSTQVQLLGASLLPGAGGWNSCGPNAPPGLSIDNHGGIVTNLPGTPRVLEGPRLASDEAALAVTIRGVPGDRVWLMSAYTPAHLFLPGLGIWTVKRPTFVPLAPLGTIPANGSLAANVPVHALPAGATQGTLFAQALVIDAAGKGFLSSALHVGVVDADAAPDCDGSQVNDFVELFTLAAADCNKNLEIDTCDIASGVAADCNVNSIPDSCDLASGLEKDCNANQVPDSCDIALGVAQDCNSNSRPDSCDIALGFSADINLNGIPDECETNPPVTWWVDDDALPGGNGTQTAPFQTIGAALNASFHGDTVLVRDGTYKGAGNKNLAINGLEVVIRSESGPANCVIDCENSGRAFSVDFINQGQGSDLRIRGLTIRNGNSQGAPTDKSQGGGIFIEGGSPRIEHCVIENCSGRMGGGIYARDSAIQVRASVIRNCVAPKIGTSSGSGGGLYIDLPNNGAQPTGLVNTTVQGCTVDGSGGGIYSTSHGNNQQLTLSHCRIIENSATGSGGGIVQLENLSTTCVLLMNNCLVAGNSAARGGGLYLGASPQSGGGLGWVLTGCTLAQNSAAQEGGTFKINASQNDILTPLELYDSVVWNSSAPLGSTLHHAIGTAVVSVASCDVQGGSSGFVLGAGSSLSYGPGNIDLDPLFVDIDGPDNNLLTIADNDYRLLAGSPCADAGDNARVSPDLIDIDSDGDLSELTPLDLLLQPRFVEDPLAPNTGQGTPPLVDLGAFERQP
jgi:hypothetical protein